MVGLDVSSGSALSNDAASSAATMTCLGETMLMQWASAAPERLVFSNPTTPPIRAMPSQIATNSGRFGMRRQIVSPLVTPFALAQRA